MKARALVTVIAVVGLAQVAVALGVWRLARPAPPAAPALSRRAPAGAERVAELIAGAAFRAVITADYASLSEVIRRAAAWSEVAFVSVEDADGKILAHTDAAKVGRLAADVGAEMQGERSPGTTEIVASMTGNAKASGAPSPGRVRLGWKVPTSAPAPVSTAPSPALPLAAVLGAAALVAVPVGFGVARLAGQGAAPPGSPLGDLRQIRTLKQAKWTLGRCQRDLEAARRDLGEREAEARTLRDDLSLRDSQLTYLRADLQARITESEQLRTGFGQEREQFAEELTRLSTQLMRANREGEVLEEALAEARAELEQAREAAGAPPAIPRELVEDELKQLYARAVGCISYAVRGALTNVLGYARLLLREAEGPLTEAQRSGALAIHQAGHRLLSLVNDLVDLARIDAKMLELRQETVDPGALLREAAAAGEEALERKPGDIAVDARSALPPVRGDRQRLRQILLALMREPAPEGPVRLHARVAGEAIAVDVEHPSIAMPPDVLADLFDPFAPLDPATPVHDVGSRLRLSLARSLATLGGGDLRVDSQPETGTIFTLRLPAVSSVS